MRIRFRVRTSPSEAHEWEHAGPRIRIGRADDCELALRGAAGDLVSGRHVAVELSPRGAAATDLGSTNGTYINGARLHGTAPLVAGDQLQLGQAGPRLDVLAIDVTAPAASVADPPAARNPPAPVATPAGPSGTQLLLVNLHRQNQRSLAIIATIGIVGIIVVAGIIKQSGKESGGQIGGAGTGGGPGGSAPIVLPVSSVTKLPSQSDATFTVRWSGGPTAAKFSVYVSDDGQPFQPFQKDTADKSAKFEGKPGHTYGFYSVATDADGNAQATPEAAQASTTIKTPSIEETTAPYQSAVVWIGFELHGREFVYGTGWAYKRNVVVTTAAVAADLEIVLEKSKQGKYGLGRFVAHHDDGSIPIKELRPHPKYDAKRPTDDACVAHNLAIALLDAELPASCVPCSPADEAELKHLNVESSLLVMGFVNRDVSGGPFDPAKDVVSLESKSARVTSSDGARSYRLSVAGADTLSGPNECLSGSPVFNQAGKLVGTMAVMASSIRMTRAADLRKWLDLNL